MSLPSHLRSRCIEAFPSGPSTLPRRTIPLAAAALCLCACVPQQAMAQAQQPIAPAPPAGSNWHRVQALPPGVAIDVKARKQHVRCKFSGATDDSLTCSRDTGAPIVLQRADVQSVKIGHRVRSTLIGAGVGGGTLAIVGFAVGTNGNADSLFGKNFLRGAIAGVFGAIGVAAGGGIGAATDFSKSTVYTAP
jgi:hypothetical protein